MIRYPEILFAFAFALTCSAATIPAASPAFNDVNAAVALAAPGDIVTIPAGKATWTNSLALAKNITLQGAGANLSTISNAIPTTANSNWYPYNSPFIIVTANDLWRITQIGFDGVFASWGIENNSSSLRGRIDNCRFQNCFKAIETFASGWGVVDHCVFANNIDMMSVNGANNSAWLTPLQLGTTNAWYFESNYGYLDSGYTRGFGPVGGDGSYGACYVPRFNVFSNYTATAFDQFWDVHGNQSSLNCPPNNGVASVKSFECYGNLVSTITAYRFHELRGGTCLVFSNIYVNMSINGPVLDLTEEDGYRASNPTFTTWPACQGLTNCYFWANTLNGGPITIGLHYPGNTPCVVGGSGDLRCPNPASDSIFIQPGRDYFLTAMPGYKPLPFPHPLTLTNNPPPAATTFTLDSPSYSIGETNTPLVITALRATGSVGACQVDMVTLDGTAVHGINYNQISTTIFWTNGDTSTGPVNMGIINSAMSTNKSCLVYLTNAIGGTIAGPSNAVVTIIGSVPPSQPILSGLSWTADQGWYTAPMGLLTNAGIAVARCDQYDTGSVSFKFSITTNGLYTANAMVAGGGGVEGAPVGSPFGGFNVLMDNETVIGSSNAWDIIATATNTFTKQQISRRGNGTGIAPQFPSQAWMLTNGTHILAFISRIPGAFLGQINVQPVSNTPTNPVAVSLAAIASRSGFFNTNAPLTFTLSWTAPVMTNGVTAPTVALNTGHSATYSSGSGTTNLTFTYTPQALDFAAPLDTTGTNAFTGSLIGTNGASVDTTMPLPGSAGSLTPWSIVIDTVGPALSIGAWSAASIGTGATSSNVFAFTDSFLSNSLALSGNIAMTTTGTATGTLQVLPLTAPNFACIVSNVTGAGTISIVAAPGIAIDIAGNQSVGGTSSALTVISNPQFVSWASAQSGTVASGHLPIQLLRSNGTSGTVTVNYATLDGTAMAGLDYTAVSGTVSLGDGIFNASINVDITYHAVATNRVFYVQLSNANGCNIVAPGTNTVTIAAAPQPGPPQTINVIVNNATINNATIAPNSLLPENP